MITDPPETGRPRRFEIFQLGDGWRVSHPSGRTLIFARNGGVWLVRESWMLLGDGRQIEGTSDYRAGKNTSTSKGRAAR